MDNFDTALVQVKKENQNYKTGSNIILTCHPREVIQLIHCSADRCLELEVKEHKYAQQANGLNVLSQ